MNSKKKQKLEKAAIAIEEHIKKETKKDWIEPDDSRYTNIVEESQKKLSKLWKKTKNQYAKKISQKNLEIDENPEDYSSPEYNSSEYIDEALAILAFAFGQAIAVGYGEIINRGFDISIPENPHELFDEATEQRNYAHAALSNEQNDMDQIFNSYNNKENAKQQIRDWFDQNEYRLTDLMAGGVVWYGINYGFARAVLEAQGTEEDQGIFLYWLTEKDSRVCIDCKSLQDNSPYTKDNPLKTLPGGGKTICGSRCRCIIDTKER